MSAQQKKASKRKKITKVTKVRRKTSRNAEGTIDALRALSSFKLMKRVLVTEYLLERMLANEMANLTRDHAEKMIESIVQMSDRSLANDKETLKLMCDLAAKALTRANDIRARMGGTSETMQ